MDKDNYVYLLEVDEQFGKNNQKTKRTIHLYSSYKKAFKAFSEQKRSFEMWLIHNEDYRESFRKFEKFTTPANANVFPALSITETIHLFQPNYWFTDDADATVVIKLVKEYIK